MKLQVENCTVVFDIDGANITSIEINKPNEKPYKIFIRKNGKTGNVTNTTPTIN